jgi:predicted acylesterase/phospholipase RssA
MKTTAKLVLSGGEALGLAQIGSLKVIEHEFEINAIIGTSIGSLVGGLYAMGLGPSEILKTALSFRKSSVFNPFSLDKQLSGIFDGKLVLKTLEEWTQGALVEDCRLPFQAVSYDLNRKKTVIIDKGPLAKAMRASSSIPYLFAPFQWGRYSFVDGGIEHPLPLGLSSSLPGEITIAVNVLPFVAETPESITLAPCDSDGSKLRLPEVFLRSITQNQAFLAMHAILDHRPDIVIEANYPDGSVFGFDQAETYYHWGISKAKEALAEYGKPDYFAQLRRNYHKIMSRINTRLEKGLG